MEKTNKSPKIKNKPKNRQQTITNIEKKKPVENRQKHRKIFKNVKKPEKTSQKYRQIVKNIEKL